MLGNVFKCILRHDSRIGFRCIFFYFLTATFPLVSSVEFYHCLVVYACSISLGLLWSIDVARMNILFMQPIGGCFRCVVQATLWNKERRDWCVCQFNWTIVMSLVIRIRYRAKAYATTISRMYTYRMMMLSSHRWHEMNFDQNNRIKLAQISLFSRAHLSFYYAIIYYHYYTIRCVSVLRRYLICYRRTERAWESERGKIVRVLCDGVAYDVWHNV